MSTITLTGFDTKMFENCINSIYEVQSFFDHHIPQDKLEECTMIDKCSNEHLGVHLTNRYFTTRSESPHALQIPFSGEVDPLGILA